MPSQRRSFLEGLSEQARREHTRRLLAELEDELRELEGLQSRIALTLARLKLLLELEGRGK